MKRKIFYYIALCAIIMLYSCSDEDILYDADGLSDGNNIYITLTMSMTSSSASTRSTTDTDFWELILAASGYGDMPYTSSSDGTVDAEDLESTVKDVLIGIAELYEKDDADFTLKNTLYVKSSPKSQGDGTYKLTIPVTEEEFNNFMSEINGIYDKQVVLILNPNEELLAMKSISSEAVTTITSTDDNSLFDDSHLLMESALRTTLPYNDTQSTNPEDHKSEATAYDLGSVRVERCVARFDYKDGSPDGDYTYSLMDGTTVKLQSLALVNMCDKHYYFRHYGYYQGVFEYGSIHTNTIYYPEFCLNYYDAEQWGLVNNPYDGEEGKYHLYLAYGVVDPYTQEIYDWIMNGADIDEVYRNHLIYNLKTPSSWEFTKFSDLTASSKHNGYMTWRYSTENCPIYMDGYIQNDQVKGNSEGVVFKAQIIDNDKKFDGESKIYVFKDKLYGTWSDVEAATTSSNSLKTAYDNVMEVWTEGKNENDADVVQAMADNGFTGYTPDSDGNYYMYYYYWNRHNDINGWYEFRGEPCPMQFAVVRNNVYGLSVTDITYFGHPWPENPDPDPYPIDPEDYCNYEPEHDNSPDDWDGGISVNVTVLPWDVKQASVTISADDLLPIY